MAEDPVSGISAIAIDEHKIPHNEITRFSTFKILGKLSISEPIKGRVEFTAQIP